MAKKPMMFGGKESASEERAEKRVGAKAYAAGEKKEGEKPNPFGAKKAAPFGAKPKPKPFACGGKVRKYAEGGEVDAPVASVREGANSNIDDDVRARAMAFVNKASAPAAKPKPKAYPEAGPVRAAGKMKLSDKYPEPGPVREAAANPLRTRKTNNPMSPRFGEGRRDPNTLLPVKYAGGGMVRGAGAATKGKKFKEC